MQEETSKHRKAFEEFESRIEEEIPEVLERVILFGSVARRKERGESDVDVLVVVAEANRKIKEKVIDVAYDITLKTGVYVSPKVISEKELERLKAAGSSFLEQIEKEGEVAYGRV